jgi:curved DNA-binding protein CbpA
MLFQRVEDLIDDLEAYASGNYAGLRRWVPSNNQIGAAILAIAGKRIPGELSDKLNAESVETLATAAQTFVAASFFAESASAYKILGLHPSADDAEVKKNYKRLMGLVHPDSHPIGFPADAASRVNKAYALLSDPVSRAVLDAELLAVKAPPTKTVAPTKRLSASAAREKTNWRSLARTLVPSVGFRKGLIAITAILLIGIGLGLNHLLFSDHELPRFVQARPATGGTSGTATLAQTGNGPSGTPSKTEPQIVAERGGASVAGSTKSQSTAKATTAESDGALVGRDAARNTAAGAETSGVKLAMSASNETRPSTATTPSTSATASPPSQSQPTSERIAPPEALGSVAAAQIVSTAPPTPAIAASAGVTTQDAETLLAQFASAFENGSVPSLKQSFSQRMASRNYLLADYERVFQNTRQRNVQFSRMTHNAIAPDRILTSGQAVVSTVDGDNRANRQRVFLEIEIAREADGAKIVRIANYEQR